MASTKELKNSLGEVFYRVEYDPVNRWAYAVWTGYATLDDVKAGSWASLEFIKVHQCKSIIHDSTRSAGAWDEANEWIAREVMPLSIQAGLRHIALVVSRDVFSQLSADSLEMHIQGIGFSYKNFNDLDEAKQWLHGQQ